MSVRPGNDDAAPRERPRPPLFVRDGRYHWTPARWQGWLVLFGPVAIVLAGAAATTAVLGSGLGGRWFVRDGPRHWSPVTWQGWLLTLGPGALAVVVSVVLVVVIVTRYRRPRGRRRHYDA